MITVVKWWPSRVHSRYMCSGGEGLVAVVNSAVVCCIGTDGSETALRGSLYQTQNINNFLETQPVRSSGLPHVCDTCPRSAGRI